MVFGSVSMWEERSHMSLGACWDTQKQGTDGCKLKPFACACLSALDPTWRWRWSGPLCSE